MAEVELEDVRCLKSSSESTVTPHITYMTTKNTSIKCKSAATYIVGILKDDIFQ